MPFELFKKPMDHPGRKPLFETFDTVQANVNRAPSLDTFSLSRKEIVLAQFRIATTRLEPPIGFREATYSSPSILIPATIKIKNAQVRRPWPPHLYLVVTHDRN